MHHAPTSSAPSRQADGSAAAFDAVHTRLLNEWIWRDFANVALGVWLVVSPATLGYGDAAMVWSDVVSGVLIVALALLTLSPRFELARWGLGAIGGWLLMAPLLFWTRDAAAYANDTLVGTLLITFAVLVPMPPGRAHHRIVAGPGPERPPGWSYNPSGWFQRGPIIAMAFVGFLASRYMAAYQLGHITSAWDPVFGEGTRRVLESDVSRAWPVSDAGLGAVAYLLEALSGFMGGKSRWRTLPWMVLLFGFLVVPLGVVSLVLVMLQPIAVGAWCGLCLFTACAMLIMIAPAVDEVVATGQFLAGARREGHSLWRVVWTGGTLAAYDTATDTTPDDPAAAHGAASPSTPQPSAARRIFQALDLSNVPVTLLLCMLLGAWTMAAPSVLGTTGRAADIDYLVGALIVTWSVVGFGEIVRPVRLLNVPMGLVLMVAPLLVGGHTGVSGWVDAAVGLGAVLLSLPRGRIDERFGSWNRYLSW